MEEQFIIIGWRNSWIWRKWQESQIRIIIFRRIKTKIWWTYYVLYRYLYYILFLEAYNRLGGAL